MSPPSKTGKYMTSGAVDKKSPLTSPEAVKPAFPFLDLKAQFASIREEVMEAVDQSVGEPTVHSRAGGKAV